MAAIPLLDDYRARRAPVVTYLLIAANVIVYLLGPMADLFGGYGAGEVRDCARDIYVAHYAAIPHELLTGHQVPVRSLVPPGCVAQAHPFHKVLWLSAFTSMFLHGGTMHLLGNMLFFYVFGSRVEDRLGHLRYLACYLAFGYVAAYGFAVISTASSTASMLGASGAIAGVLGTYFVLNPRGRITALVVVLPFRLPAWVLLGSWFVLQWVSLDIGTGDTAYGAHVCGFCAGMLLGSLLRLNRRGAYRTGALFAWR